MSPGRIAAIVLPGLIALSGAAPVEVASEGRQPQAAVDAKGRIYVAYGVGDTIKMAVSTDRGRSFGPPLTVGQGGVLSLGMRRGPRVAVSGEAVVVVGIAGKQGKGKDGDLLAWRSVDQGRTWSGPTRINTSEGSGREGLHALAAGPDGTLFATWLDLRDKRSELYGAVSRDGGVTWEADRLIYRSPDGGICPCCHPSAAFGPDGTLFVMWRNALGGFRDMYLARSRDGGRTFEPAAKLGREGWALNACPMDGGAIAAGPGDRVDTVWMRSGSMFAAAPGRAERPLGRGVQGWTVAGPDGPYSVWLARRPGALLAQTPTSPGPITLAEEAGDPMVAASPAGQGPVVAVWESGKSIRSLVLSPTPEPTGSD